MKPNTHKPHITRKTLLEFNPCPDGLAFLKQHKTLKAAWLACDNPEWMIWALTKYGLFDDRMARTFVIKCAYHTLHLFENDYPQDKRPRLALEAAQGFLDGTVNQEQLAAAWDAARDAAWAAESKWQAETLRSLINPFKK